MPRPRFDEENSKSEQTLDLFSHDSTHVRLVIEAEKQSNLARSKAMDILQKYSKDFGTEDDKDMGIINAAALHDEERDEGELDIIDPNSESPYIQTRTQYLDTNAHVTNQDVDVNSFEGSDGGVEQQKEDVFDDKCDELTEEDLEHIAHCLYPLSPKGLKRNKAKNVSGRFEFRRINSGSVSVVKSHRQLDVMSPEELQKLQPSPGNNQKLKSPKSNSEFSPKKGKRGGLRRRFSFSSRSRTGKDMDSGIHTDDACLHGTDDESNRDKSQPHAAQLQASPLHKEVKEGDLPPKPTPKPKPVRKMSMGAPSSRATASDVDYDEVISVVSNMSDISEVSIAEKAKERGPVVLTEAMLKTAVIPETICLKTKVKLTRIEVLRRKLSFGKGKI